MISFSSLPFVNLRKSSEMVIIGDFNSRCGTLPDFFYQILILIIILLRLMFQMSLALLKKIFYLANYFYSIHQSLNT